MVNFHGHTEVSKIMIEVSHCFSLICTMIIVTEGLSPFLSLFCNTVVFVCEVLSTHPNPNLICMQVTGGFLYIMCVADVEKVGAIFRFVLSELCAASNTANIIMVPVQTYVHYINTE